jgi:PIN domain nuclease of toxin-antitoxin system
VYVLDSSIIIAIAQGEAGSDLLLRYLEGAVMSSVNYAEVLQKVAQLGRSVSDARIIVRDMDVGIVPHDEELAAETAMLWPATRKKGLSLADRACLALARSMNAVAVTADRAWADLDIGADVQVISRPPR